jgi:hypothetical protein
MKKEKTLSSIWVAIAIAIGLGIGYVAAQHFVKPHELTPLDNGDISRSIDTNNK